MSIAATGVNRVVFAEFEWKHQNFLNIKTEEWDIKFLLFNYWNGLALDSLEISFLEVGAHMIVKRATTDFWEGGICWI